MKSERVAGALFSGIFVYLPELELETLDSKIVGCRTLFLERTDFVRCTTNKSDRTTPSRFRPTNIPHFIVTTFTDIPAGGLPFYQMFAMQRPLYRSGEDASWIYFRLMCPAIRSETGEQPEITCSV